MINTLGTVPETVPSLLFGGEGMTIEKKYRIQRTNKSCEIIKDQQVYAEWQEITKSWKIHNVKGKPFEIPANKLYHPLAEFFIRPTSFTWFKCNFKIGKWRKRYNKEIRKLKISETLKYKFHMDNFGVFVTQKGDKKREFYFQFRKEDFKRFKEFIAG